MEKLKSCDSLPPPVCQLPLPLPELEPRPPCLPNPLVTLRPEQVWANLPLAARISVQTTLLRVIQEVLHDYYRS